MIELVNYEHHRLAQEQEEAILIVRAKGCFVVMSVGKDGRKHYKASCDLTQDDVKEEAV